jgi:homoserine kinase
VSEIAGRAVTIEVPATSANLGPGYDALALALDLHLRVTIKPMAEGESRLAVHGQGAGRLALDASNRFLAGWQRGLAEVSVGEPLAVDVEMTNDIPLRRGLGSSAAATVAGLLAAEAFSGTELGPDWLLGLAAEIEGHADNAAAALLGGFVVVSGGRVVRFEPPRDLRAVLFIPARELATDEMRAVLPSTVSHADAVHNTGRVALLVSAFATSDLSLLAAMDDRLHEPYRAAVYPELPALLATAREAGALGAALSGAGSSVIALCDSGDVADAVQAALSGAAARLGLAGNVHAVAPSSHGARILAAGDG